MDLSTWPGAIFALGVLVLAALLFMFVFGLLLEHRQKRLAAGQETELRQLVQRYEHLAENTLDAQQRVAADVSELRSRTTAIEQILRTVE